MASSLSNIFDNLIERIHKIKCSDCNCFLEYESVKDNLIKYKCLFCNKNYSKKIDKNIKRGSRIQLRFLIMIIKNLFCFWEKAFILMNIGMSRKSLMKHHYLKKENLT